MTVSENIRALETQGLSVTEIASRLGIRYQHAYNVLNKDGSLPPRRPTRTTVRVSSRPAPIVKPQLSVDTLIVGGFTHSSRWVLTDAGEIALDQSVDKASGVYAYAIDTIVMYVGVATIGIAKRLYHYTKPGNSQLTNIRVNSLIKAELETRPYLDVYTAVPGNLEWNGLPVNGSAGLEFGLIQTYALPWNVRSAK